jgi:hypothetical protein
MAQMMRVGLYRPVHVKTLRSQKLRMLLTHRKLVQSKAIFAPNPICSVALPGKTRQTPLSVNEPETLVAAIGGGRTQGI